MLIASRFLGIWQTGSSSGIQIDYPSIIVHGQQGESVMLEMSMKNDGEQGIDDDDDLVQIYITPLDTVSDGHGQANGHGTHPSAIALYKAIEACQELNPSPEEDEQDFDASLPGDGGWITSENAHLFTGEDGQFAGIEALQSESLGPGAGTTRTAPDTEDDAKWQRTG